jgi:TIR domain
MRSFKVFLSHRYKSPEVNLFFFDLFDQAKQADIQFEVDSGTFAANVTGQERIGRSDTNVTRLERMVRDSDAFLGIFPFPGESGVTASREELLKASRYFRLELDLAIRSRKPAMIIYDKRYRAIFDAPITISQTTFDAQEISGGGSSPSAEVFLRAFSNFCETVEASMKYENTRRAGKTASSKVGLLVPPEQADAGGYSVRQIDFTLSKLSDSNYDPIQLPWPPVLDLRFNSLIEDFDWIVTDIGQRGTATGLAAYLHGRFIPTLRLKQLLESAETVSPLESVLYGGVEVGYAKDVVRWRESIELESGLANRLAVINEPVRRIKTWLDACDYFRVAALREEVVFLSYSGEDSELAARISTALKKRFRVVFDYRDGSSIHPGQPWLKEIFERLSGSAIGVILLSENYLRSGNCEHEAQEIVSRVDGKHMKLLPVRLYDKTLDLPTWLSQTQYVRLTDLNNDYGALAQEVVKLFPTSRPTSEQQKR